jgi:WD40 repeat protein
MSAITELHHIDLNSGQITKPRWSPNGRLLAVPGESGSIAIFDMNAGRVTQTLGAHSGAVTSVCWDRESELIMTGSLDRSVGVWELNSGSRAPFNPNHKEPVHSVEWTDEGAYAMTCSADRVCAWDGFCLQKGCTEQMEQLVNKNTGFTAASCSYHTTLLLGMAAENGSLLVLASLVSADVLDSVRIDDPIRCLTWSPAEDLIAAATSHSILIFHPTQTGFAKPARELTGDTSGVHALTFSGDGRLLASRDAKSVKIWNLRSAKLIASIDEDVEAPPLGGVTSGIALHPTTPLLALATLNGFRILDLSKL